MINDIDVDRYNRKRLIVLFFNINKHQYSIRLKNSDIITPSHETYDNWERQREIPGSDDKAECVPMYHKDRAIITFIRDKSFTKIIVNKIIRLPKKDFQWSWIKYSKLIINKNGYFNFDTL